MRPPNFIGRTLLNGPQLFSEAIEYDPLSAELYRNRSAAFAVVKDWKRAVADADHSIELDNSAKSHCRKAEAYFNWGIQQKVSYLIIFWKDRSNFKTGSRNLRISSEIF